MEKIFKEIGEQSLGQAFFQDIATSFSCSASRAGKSAITWEQVQSWFQNRQEQLQDKVTPSSGALKLFDDLSDVPISSKAPESSLNPKAYDNKVNAGKKISDLSGLTYEAKSKKDNAWYDVASFLNYKFLSTGELINVRHEPQLLGLFQARASFGPLLAVRVRFSGFGNEEDEWVNVKRGVRERSIPLEHSECQKVKVGDLVLCFQEREDHAVYHDAYVVGIHKRQHDIRGCRCIFTVRYDHDNTEEHHQDFHQHQPHWKPSQQLHDVHLLLRNSQ
nr:protein sawadee homeodomain like 1 [Quercus suber]